MNRRVATLKGFDGVAEKGLDLKANRDAYLQAWESELAAVGSELVQSSSTAWCEAVAAAFTDVVSAAKAARVNCTLFMKDISAIRIALENDLTPGLA